MKREIFIGQVGIGGNHPVSIQSMTSTDTGDSRATLQQINDLKNEGCDIVRVAVPDQQRVRPFQDIVGSSPLPVVADIHFDAALAIAALQAGAQGLRINPGNIGSKQKLKQVLSAAGERGVPIRIGVNSGSLEKKYRHSRIPLPQAMAQSAMDAVKFFEDNQFFDIKLSLKSSSVKETISAYRLIDQQCQYPLHVGVTEAGTLFSGTVKSTIGIGVLLLQGIGNTIRVSLTADPLEEVRLAKEILAVVGLRKKNIELISCPTCSRTSVDLLRIIEELETRLKTIKSSRKIKVAVMGCEVNGPVEAMDATIGLAFSKQQGFIFKDGKLIEKVRLDEALDRLVQLIEEL